MPSIFQRLKETAQLAGSSQEKNKKFRWSLILSLGLTILFLFLALKDAKFSEIKQISGSIQVIYLVYAVGISTMAYILRATRWSVLLSAEKKLPIKTVFWANMIGYLGNGFLPARAGEMLRAIAIGNQGGISKMFALATGVTERILDVIALVIIALITLPFIKVLPSQILTAIQWMGAAGLFALAFLFVLPVAKPLLNRVVNHLPVSWRSKYQMLLENALVGFRSIQSPQRAISFVVLTALIWVTDALGTAVGVRALNLSLSLPQALLFLVTLGLSSAIPTPGNLGVYQWVAVQMLPQFGFTNNEALVYIVIAQAISYVFISFWGILSLWQIDLLKR